MGFGRVGRNLFRLAYQLDSIEIAAVSDVADETTLEYLLKYDSLHGNFPDEVSFADGHIYAAGQQIPLIAGGDPGEIDWAPHDVDVVIEATSRSRTRDEHLRHIDRGAGRVILCSPPLDDPDITVVVGVNDGDLLPSHRIVSNGSATAHCAAPILKILDEAFGIEKAFLNSVHAYTNKQRLADVPAEDMRSGRAAVENIIPQETNADEVILSVYPELAGKLVGSAMNVPVANGSIVDLTCWHGKPVTALAINEVVRTAAASKFPDIVDYVEDPIVSTDIEGSFYSSTFDGLSTMVLGDSMSKTIAWFDNHWGYVNRVIDLLFLMQALDNEEAA